MTKTGNSFLSSFNRKKRLSEKVSYTYEDLTYLNKSGSSFGEHRIIWNRFNEFPKKTNREIKKLHPT